MERIRTSRRYRRSVKKTFRVVRVVSTQAWMNAKAPEKRRGGVNRGTQVSKGPRIPGDSSSPRDVLVHVVILVMGSTAIPLNTTVQGGELFNSIKLVYEASSKFQAKVISVLESYSKEELKHPVRFDTIDTRRGEVPVLAHIINWNDLDENVRTTISRAGLEGRQSSLSNRRGTPSHVPRKVIRVITQHAEASRGIQLLTNSSCGIDIEEETASQIDTVLDEGSEDALSYVDDPEAVDDDSNSVAIHVTHETEASLFDNGNASSADNHTESRSFVGELLEGLGSLLWDY
ncbi:hypothetical protein OF83DRAFT_672599 [Amylostereum chailletii]|nr:hypothetical protein OF83DRAFT_672599 [Amylostereum chailletii]